LSRAIIEIVLGLFVYGRFDHSIFKRHTKY